MLPPARARKLYVCTFPTSQLLRTRHIGGDRPNDSDYGLRTESFNRATEASLASLAYLSAFCRAELVDRPPTHVDEIAAHIAKRFKEVSIIKLRESADKMCLA